MNWFDELIDEALDDSYLQELIVKAEKCYSYHLFGISSIANNLEFTDKEYNDILRFSDILCRSKDAVGRNKAYKIISLLYDRYKDDQQYKYFANAILTKLGIFPAIKLIKGSMVEYSTIESKLEKAVKETCQASLIDGNIFTDAQYKLFDKLKNSNHFSFSGPTSFGKSFIMEAFIKYIIEERHAIDNIVVLVPTRALINQVSKKMKAEFEDTKYKILTHPIVPTIYRKKDYKYIFVFTPERWISYVSEKSNPLITYMFIDEAQKIVSKSDSRAPLYYHAILLAERKSVKLYFASPNIPNAKVFLQLFEKSQDENMVIKDSPVSQNRFFVDFVENKAIMFSDTGHEFSIPYNASRTKGFLECFFKQIGSGCKNIVYCNTIEDTIIFSLKFSKTLPIKKDSRIDEVIELIKNYIHKEYYLIDCLQHGVAFHFGRLPQRVRERVEWLFSERAIDYVFCTSTLLEGVNLPAKNIFILSNAIGMSKFSDIDFWNLAGRAGRLSKELSGNIICVRAESKKNRWDTPSKDLEIVRNRNVSNLAPSVITGEKNFYKNIGNSITGMPFTKKNASQAQKDIWNHYANILYIHQIENDDSILISNFLKKNSAAKVILNTIQRENQVPKFILEQCSNIKPKYQNKLWTLQNIAPLPLNVTKENCDAILNNLYNYYNWSVEESGGHSPLIKDKVQLQYYSVLMYSWISGKPLSMIINGLIKYYKVKEKIWHQGTWMAFDSKDKLCINIVINNLMSDIDTSLRFKIKNYILNYSLICSARFGKESADNRWVDYLEYGTIDPLIIELQNMGIPRHLSAFIIDNYIDCITFDDNKQLIDFDEVLLQRQIDRDVYSDEYKELSELFEWSNSAL